MIRMFLEKIVSEKLEHFSYMIGSNGEAAIIDPRRDFQIYLEIARKKDVKIKYIFETHRNEDYVIGSMEINAEIDVPIFHGNRLSFSYGSPVKENDTFSVGSLELTVLETPGHTEESISISVKDNAVSSKELLVFSGDTLFAGDSGRIDLYGEKDKMYLAEQLYQSIHHKILPLGNEVIVCPAHGSGSVCGESIGDKEYTTIGFEKKTNPQLNMKKQDFIFEKNQELHLQPPYFSIMEKMNKKGPLIRHRIPFPSSLPLESFKELLNDNNQIIDIRDPISYASAHVPGSINIWREGIPLFAGWFLDYKNPILLIDDDNHGVESVTRFLFRLGFDNIKGYLQNGFSTWPLNNENVSSFELWPVKTFYKNMDDDSLFIIDVREESMRKKNGFIKGSKNIFVGEIEKHLSDIPKEKTSVVYCNSGKMTGIACSILKKHNYLNVINILGGFTAWKNADLPIKS